jgi:quercetin dioxygenase-like cupin family protein
MSKAAMARQRQIGETSGSPCRAPHQVSDLPLGFDLGAEQAQLRAEETWSRHRHNAKTLVKEGDLRVVLMTLGCGTRIDEHRAPGRTAIQTLSGRIRLHLPEQTVELPAGRLLAIAARVPHDVEALEDSAFLLTIGCPGN